jgi:catechol 2,3-dioxygenase-like lactoylglutathione lyase family enzyme
MSVKHLSIGIITPHLAECRRFYGELFGLVAIYESDWYIHLRMPGSSARIEIGLLAPQHASQPPGMQSAYGGAGAFINLEVDDVAAYFAKAKTLGAPIELEICDESWGERHFLVRDPAGMIVNVFQKLHPPPHGA